MWSTRVRPAPALGCVLAGGLELDVPDLAQVALGIDEVDQAAAEAAHRRDLQLAGADGLAEGLVEQLLRAVERGGGILHPQADGAHGGAVRDVVGVREAFLLGVDDDVDGALPPARHRLRLVHSGPREAEALQRRLEGDGAALVDGELDELGAEAFRSRRQRGKPRLRGAGPRPQLVEQEQQRAVAVDGHAAGRARAELVVEDLERERAVEAGGLQRAHEVEQGEVALAREVAEVPAPRQRVHVEHRRVGDLHQEDAVARDRAHGLEIGLARQRVEAVQHQADGRMVGAAHRLPGVAIVVDVAAPGQRLEADAQAALFCPLAQLVEVGRRAVDAAEAFGRDVRAHQQEIAAELLHQVELALGAREHALALVGRHALEIAERLEGDDLEPQVGHQLAHVGGRAAEGEQVVLEDLDALEAGAGDGVELLGEVAAQGDRGNRHLHGLPPRICAPALRRPPPALPHRARQAPPRTCDACARRPAVAQ